MESPNVKIHDIFSKLDVTHVILIKLLGIAVIRPRWDMHAKNIFRKALSYIPGAIGEQWHIIQFAI